MDSPARPTPSDSAPPAPADARPRVGSVVQAMTILRYLGSRETPQGVTAIAHALGISPSSCFNILKTLVDEDLVTFDAKSKYYTLGLGALELARMALKHDPLLTLAQEPMRRLAEHWQAACGLWRVSVRDRLVLAALAESGAATRIHMLVGQRQPLTAGATGRVVMAARDLDDAAIANLIQHARWARPPSVEDYRAQLAKVRAQGWALDTDQTFQGITTVAAAVADKQGVVRFCLSLTMFSGQYDSLTLNKIGQDVAQRAEQLALAAYGERLVP